MAGKTNGHKGQINLFKGEVPKMPEGYYSGDKPNPNLRAFVEAHLRERPYDPATDDYDVPAFDKPIETTKATAIYNMHTYWSKKPHDAIRQYIRHYTKPGDLVLDPFCGSGGTALAALMDGRKAIAIDRSPAATFITKNYCMPVDVEELKKSFEELKQKVKPEIDWLYETRCDRCGGRATTAYTVYSQVFQCPRCLEKVPLFDCVEVEGETAKGKPKKVNTCPFCDMRGIVEEISTRTKKFGAVPVLVSYICEGDCKPKRSERRHNDPDSVKRVYFAEYDLGKIREIELCRIPHWYPVSEFPKSFSRWKSDLRLQGVEKVYDLFTKRSLWALACMLAAINNVSGAYLNNTLFFVFHSNIFQATILQQYRQAGGGFAKGTYYIPPIWIERNQKGCLERKLKDIGAGLERINNLIKCTDILISTEDSRFLTIASDVVDYIFTDPPYADKVQYGELNYVWETWFDFDSQWHDEEIIVNEVRGKSEADWMDGMRQAMKECYRVLKPGRWLSLCYHDTSEGTWALVQDIMAEVGFLVDKSDSALFIDTGQKSYNQLTADKVNKRDLVINFRKPRSDELSLGTPITGDEDEATFSEKVRAIIREHLAAHPGAAKDRIYDEVVSRMVRSGSMEAHNFDELLRQVAEEIREPIRKNLFEYEQPRLFGLHEVSRWYLKENEDAELDAAESAREDDAALKISRYIAEYTKNNPAAEGVHYSDLFELYVYTVKDKPRRPLAEWLLDYFYKTESGTYRLPASEEEKKLKAEGRARGTIRRVKRYIAFLQQGVPVPEKERPNEATLAEWIRHCKRSGLYEQGKFLYEKGGLNLDGLPDELVVSVEEDYQTCVRALVREAGSPLSGKPARGRKKKEPQI